MLSVIFFYCMDISFFGFSGFVIVKTSVQDFKYGMNFSHFDYISKDEWIRRKIKGLKLSKK